MTPEPSAIDEVLVLRCQEGDVAAFETLVERWQQRLWRHARQLTGDTGAAWDALQEAWVGISRGIAGLDDPAMFPGWAFRIVTNKCRDWVRQRRRQRRLEEGYAAECERSHDSGPTTDSSLTETLEQLSGADRAILALRYADGFRSEEIATILGIPDGTVRSRLFYARQRLRNYLEGNDERA